MRDQSEVARSSPNEMLGAPAVLQKVTRDPCGHVWNAPEAYQNLKANASAEERRDTNQEDPKEGYSLGS